MFIGGSAKFLTKNGEEKTGKIIRVYPAFEGGMRVILETSDGKQYRCVPEVTEDKRTLLKEYVV